MPERNISHNMRKPIVVMALLIVCMTAFIIYKNSQVARAPADSSQTTSIESLGHPSSESTDAQERPYTDKEPAREMVKSVYDLGLDYRVAAQKAVEDRMQHYPRDSYLRWEAIRVDANLYLAGSYRDEGALPASIALTPFPDISIVADRTEYTVMEHVQGAIWRGSIRGTENGHVEISIVKGDESPEFVIRFLSYPNLISISPLDGNKGLYVAVEGNPDYEIPSEPQY